MRLPPCPELDELVTQLFEKLDSMPASDDRKQAVRRLDQLGQALGQSGEDAGDMD
jgi:hypothetical protein